MRDLSTGYVLVGHAPADRRHAGELCRELQSHGIRAHYDERGDSIEQLIKLTKKADVLLVLVTPAAPDYEPLSRQIEVAQNDDIPAYGLVVDNSRPMLEAGDLRQKWPVVRGGRLPADAISTLTRDVDASEPPPGRKIGVPLAIGAAAVAAVLAVVITLMVARRSGVVADPGPTTGGTTTTAPPGVTTTAAAGQVTITSPGDGGVVKKCQHFSGAAALPPGDTIMYGVNRVSPRDKAWYYGYIGSYGNGYVPSTWSGDVYFGSATSQKYDMFVYVMSVAAAHQFWDAHKTKDGSFAFGDGPPPGVQPAAHVRVTQGSLDDC